MVSGKPWACLLSALLCGWLFAMGLGLSGMTRPSKIQGFLDVTGTFDPTLLLVMGGAVAVGLMTFPAVLRQPAPILGGRFLISEKTRIDFRLLGGAALFGVGWGLVGYCPGPAVMSLVALNPLVWIFVLAMLAGLRLGQWLSG